jgi:hypothetical protein
MKPCLLIFNGLSNFDASGERIAQTAPPQLEN